MNETENQLEERLVETVARLLDLGNEPSEIVAMVRNVAKSYFDNLARPHANTESQPDTGDDHRQRGQRQWVIG